MRALLCADHRAFDSLSIASRPHRVRNDQFELSSDIVDRLATADCPRHADRTLERRDDEYCERASLCRR